MVNIIDQPLAHSELEDFQKYWDDSRFGNDKKILYCYAVTGGTGPDVSGDQDFQKIDRWPCTLFWRRITVTDDGAFNIALTIGCINQVGHLDQSSIKDIWTSETYNTLRNYHLNGQQYKIHIALIAQVARNVLGF